MDEGVTQLAEAGATEELHHRENDGTRSGFFGAATAITHTPIRQRSCASRREPTPRKNHCP